MQRPRPVGRVVGLGVLEVPADRFRGPFARECSDRGVGVAGETGKRVKRGEFALGPDLDGKEAIGREKRSAAVPERPADPAQEGLRIDTAGIHYFSRWITPLGAPRRYDTRFFVAAAPPEQEPLHDDREVVASRWFTPAEALRRHDAGEITMIFPTVRTLVALDRFGTAADVLAHARSLARVEAVLPLMRESPDGIRIVLPGDPEHTGGTYDAFTAQPVDDDLA